MNVTADNVTLDCNGFSITGNASGIGVVSTQFNTTVKNCTLSTFETGIEFDGTTGGVVSRNTVANVEYGFYLSNASNNTVTRNTFEGDTVELYLDANSSNNTITLNFFADSPGYYAYDAAGLNLFNATVEGLNQGNFYDEVEDGIVHVWGTTASTLLPLFIGTNGAVPYNDSASLGKVFSVTDYAPLTAANDSVHFCTELDVPNTVYTLTEDINESNGVCFGVGADNVTIDCAGYSIIGEHHSVHAGIISMSVNTTIKNCFITGFGIGIYFDGPERNGSIINTTAVSTQTDADFEERGGLVIEGRYNYLYNVTGISELYYGIFVERSYHNFSKVTANSSSDIAFFVEADNSSFSEISAWAAGEQPGIYVEGNGNSFQSVNATAADGNDALFVEGSDNNFSGINATSNSGTALYVDGTGNNFVQLAALSSLGAASIYLYGSNNTFSHASSVASDGTSINVIGSYENFTAVNATSGSDVGVFVSGSRNSFYGLQSASTSGDGIYLTGSENNFSRANASSDSGYALQIEDGLSNNFTASVFSSNTGSSVAYLFASYSTFANNTFISQNGAGNLVVIYAGNAENTFYWNNFTDTAGYYVQDDDGGNYYNSSAGGQNEGNIWQNVISGAILEIGTIPSIGFPGLYIGTTAYDGAVSLGKVSDAVMDYVPLTPVTPSPSPTPSGGSGNSYGGGGGGYSHSTPTPMPTPTPSPTSALLSTPKPTPSLEPTPSFKPVQYPTILPTPPSNQSNSAKDYGKALAAVNTKLREAVSRGLEVDSVQQIISLAGRLTQAGDYAGAVSLLDQASAQLETKLTVSKRSQEQTSNYSIVYAAVISILVLATSYLVFGRQKKRNRKGKK